MAVNDDTSNMTAQHVGAHQPSHDLNGPRLKNYSDVQEKYDEERSKRLRSDGPGQWIDLHGQEKYSKYMEDPWVAPGTPINTPVPDGGRVKIIICGAGFGGIIMAVKLLQAGFKHKDILIVDPAGGFGGTWYWNRYPGLMCDVESYIYLPFLEETGYIPKDRYASGNEILLYINLICDKYQLRQCAMFQSVVKEADWDDDKKDWAVQIVKKPKGGADSDFAIRADYFIFASGIHQNPKLADLPGLLEFQGHNFHTARWDYDYTGGSAEHPELTGLKGKTVAIVGTGATAVQAVPHLARFAKELYVVQRTPSSIDVRDNRATDPVTFKDEVATGKGWWKERNANFIRFVSDDPSLPSKDLVNDGWTGAPSFSAMIGGPREVTPETMTDHVKRMHALDAPRSARIRARVDEVVTDNETADSLKPWYPGWCKRPCFHDEYLQAFNLPNVHLIDTDGKGIDKITKKGFVANGKEYPIDVIIWSTGFRSPVVGSPASKSNVVVKGPKGLDFDETTMAMDVHTLHGVVARKFPNLFYVVASQYPANVNWNYAADTLSTHIAYMIATAEAKVNRPQGSGKEAADGVSKAGSNSSRHAVIEPTQEAVDGWAKEIARGQAARAALGTCTPSYFNLEGALFHMTAEQREKGASVGLFVRGMQPYVDIIEGWREKGDMEGLDVIAVA